jgi:uncharacterized RDD family membrane protein YckC
MVAQPMVTGDAVVLDVAIAQLPVRAISAFIDVAIMFIGYFVGLILAATVLTRFDDALAGAVVVIFTVLTIVGYPLVLEVATRGRTLGKMAMGLRVVSDDGGPERFRQALFRALASVIEIWLFVGGPAVICSLLSSKGKRIGDVFAGTMVISERTPRPRPLPPMPPALAWWAASLQMSGLRPEQADRARQFLSRASQLDARIRDELGYRICSEIVAQVSPPPPPGTPPPLILAAVLAERHRRELQRLQPAPTGYPPPGYAQGYQPAYPPPAAPQSPYAPPPPAPPQPSGGFTAPD